MARRYRFRRWILDYRLLALLALVFVSIAGSYLMPVTQNHQNSASGYPSVVCPANLGDGSTTTSLASNSLNHKLILPVSAAKVVAKVAKKSSPAKSSAKKVRIAKAAKKVKKNANKPVTLGASYPMLVAGSAASDWSLNQSSGGIGATVCTSGATDEWFVGGSALVTSQDTLELVNSGAGTATAIATAYGSHSQSAPMTISIKAGVDQRVSLDSLMPGEASVVLHLEIKSGRVAAFLYAAHKKGLTSLGADFISPQLAPGTHLVIPAVINSTAKSPVTTALRLLAPGAVATKVHVTALSGDGSFVPMNFDQITLSPGMVTDLPFTNLTSATPMTFVVDGDQPILAAAITSTSSEFAWSSSQSAIAHFAANFPGDSPTIVLTSGRSGAPIKALVDYQTARGVQRSQTVTASEFATINLGPIKTLDINNLLSATSAPLYATAIIRTGSGYTYLPLIPGSLLETSTNPIANLAALARTGN